MTIYSIIFYLLAAVILAATVLAITRRNLVHSVIYLIFSFFGSAMLFYLLGAPLLAALEVIIYAGAIMVLFLFIIMMLDMENVRERFFPATQWIPAAGLSVVMLVVGILMMTQEPGGGEQLLVAAATPADFGRFLFGTHWLSVEIVSMLLLIALVGVIRVGRGGENGPQKEGRR